MISSRLTIINGSFSSKKGAYQNLAHDLYGTSSTMRNSDLKS